VNITNDLIREFQPADEAEVVKAWYRSGIATYTFLPTWRNFTGPLHRQVCHDAFIEGGNPNRAVWLDDVIEDPARLLKCV
jgi:hypothetical protein